MRPPLSVRISAYVLILMFGAVTGVEIFWSLALNMPHNLFHFVTFWSVIVTLWIAYITFSRPRIIYSKDNFVSPIQMIPIFLLGIMMMITGSLLYILP